MRDKLKRINRILSAREGAKVPKFYNGASLFNTPGQNSVLSLPNITIRASNIGYKEIGEIPTIGGNVIFDKDMATKAKLLQSKIDSEKFTKDFSKQYGSEKVSGNINPIDTTKESNFNAEKVGNFMGQASDILGGFIPKNQNLSSLTSGLDLGFNAASNVMMLVNPLIGGIMKAGGLVADGLTAMGIGTDLMTTKDRILDSKFLKLTPTGLINSLGAKKSRDFSADLSTLALVGSSYGGSVMNINNAIGLAGKKYGLFSSGDRRDANNQINEAERLLNLMTGIAKDASDRFSMRSDLNYLSYNTNMAGGYDLRYMRAAKHGAKLIKEVINSKEIVEWIPLEEIEWNIPLELELFKDGGTIEESLKIGPSYSTIDWNPWSITLQELLENEEIVEWIPLEEIEWNIPLELELFKDGGTIEESLKIGPSYSTIDWNPWSITLQELLENEEIVEWIPLEEIEQFKKGGKTEELEAPEIEETNLKNIIPEGALHKNKHHMENDENITKKGIPVVDNEGEQLAEVEKEEIIFSLEVTKKLEELYHDFYKEETSNKEKDELAIQAGQLLVKEILFNTEDRVGLIDKCKEGGKL